MNHISSRRLPEVEIMPLIVDFSRRDREQMNSPESDRMKLIEWNDFKSEFFNVLLEITVAIKRSSFYVLYLHNCFHCIALIAVE